MDNRQPWLDTSSNVNLEEKYAEHVAAQVVSLLETGVMTDRGKIYVYNALHALIPHPNERLILDTFDSLQALQP
eukprot:1297938-Prymnesium_polylepis.1